MTSRRVRTVKLTDADVKLSQLIDNNIAGFNSTKMIESTAGTHDSGVIITVRIQPSLHAKFVAKVIAEHKNKSTVLRELIVNYTGAGKDYEG